MEFTRGYDLKLDGEIELGNNGYLILVYEGKAEVKADGIKIEIDNINKQMVYVDAGVKVSFCGSGRLCIKTPR